MGRAQSPSGGSVSPSGDGARSPRPAPRAAGARMLVGWREWVGLPELGVAAVKAKIDTGARTSAIHAFTIEPFTREGEDWVAFVLHPVQGDNTVRVACEARVHDRRVIKSSSGHEQHRYVIRTALVLGGETWPVELTLARRDEMGFRMLIGRSALRRRVVVDPARSFLCSPKDMTPPAQRGPKG